MSETEKASSPAAADEKKNTFVGETDLTKYKVNQIQTTHRGK